MEIQHAICRRHSRIRASLRIRPVSSQEPYGRRTVDPGRIHYPGPPPERSVSLGVHTDTGLAMIHPGSPAGATRARRTPVPPAGYRASQAGDQ